LVTDNCHYDEARGLWCPLAVALNVPARVEVRGRRLELTNRRAEDAIRAIGREHDTEFSLNSVSQIEGKFYRLRRYDDLRWLVLRLANEEDGVDRS
jgi:hypothetical protein